MLYKIHMHKHTSCEISLVSVVNIVASSGLFKNLNRAGPGSAFGSLHETYLYASTFIQNLF